MGPINHFFLPIDLYLLSLLVVDVDVSNVGLRRVVSWGRTSYVGRVGQFVHVLARRRNRSHRVPNVLHVVFLSSTVQWVNLSPGGFFPIGFPSGDGLLIWTLFYIFIRVIFLFSVSGFVLA